MPLSRMAFTAVLGIALSACSTIDYTKRVEGWPALTVEVHRVPSPEMRDACMKYAAPSFETPMACSLFYFAEKVCRVWLPNDTGSEIAFLEEHERAHCAGYDHPGSSAMQQMFDNSKGPT